MHFAQSYLPNAPLSSAHWFHVFQVCFSLLSTRLLPVHFTPPSPLLASWCLPCLHVHLHVPSAPFLLQPYYYSVVVKKMKFPLANPVCEAHSAIPSPLTISKPTIHPMEGIQRVIAHAFVQVIWRVAGRLCILWVGCRL